LKTTVTHSGSYTRILEVEIPVEDVKPYITKAFNIYRKKISVDGFRKGKVPQSIIQKQYGEAIQAEAADQAVQAFYKKAIAQEEIHPVAPGTIQDISFDENKPLIFKAEIEVEPEIKVSNYQGLKVEKEMMKVDDQDVQKTLEILQEQKAKLEVAEGAAEKGNIIEGDVQAIDSSGVPLIGNKWEDRVFELGKAPLGDLIEEQLVGARVGEDKRFSIEQPPESNPEGQPKVDHYSIHVKSIKKKILPSLDDAFAKEMGEFDSFNALKKDIKKNLEARRDSESEQGLRNRLAEEVIRKNDFELPPSLVKIVLDGMWREYQRRPDSQVTEEQFKEDNKPRVLWNLKWVRIWQKVAEQESLVITDEEANEKINEAVQQSPEQEKKIRSLYKDKNKMEKLKEDLLEEKVINFIKDHAKIKEVVLKKSKKEKSSLIV